VGDVWYAVDNQLDVLGPAGLAWRIVARVTRTGPTRDRNEVTIFNDDSLHHPGSTLYVRLQRHRQRIAQ